MEEINDFIKKFKKTVKDDLSEKVDDLVIPSNEYKPAIFDGVYRGKFRCRKCYDHVEQGKFNKKNMLCNNCLKVEVGIAWRNLRVKK